MLLFMDGADHYATADGLKKWNAFGTGVTINATAGRRGGGAISFTSTGRFVSKVLPTTYSTLIVGWALNPAGLNTAEILHFLDGATVHCGLQLNANNALVAFRGTSATVLGTSANNVIASTGYSFIECKVTISDTVGAMEVHVNSVPVLTLTGLDTRNAGNATCSGFKLISTGTSSCVDDIYVCDTSGATNNNFLGDVRVEPLTPIADGSYSQFLPSTGSSHFTLVDDATPNTTDYNDGANAGDRDSYVMSNLPPLTSQNVFAVQVNAAVMKDDAGTKGAATFIRVGGTNGDGTPMSLNTSQTFITQVYEQNPNGGIAFTEASVNALEAGVVVTA